MYKFICANITKSRNFTSSYKKLAQNKKYHLDGSSSQAVQDKDYFEEKWEENQEQNEEEIGLKPRQSRPSTSTMSDGRFPFAPSIKNIKSVASLPSLKMKNHSKFSAGNFLAVETSTPSISKKYFHVYNITPIPTALKRYCSTSSFQKLQVHRQENENYKKAMEQLHSIQKGKTSYQWKEAVSKPANFPPDVWMKKYKKKSKTEITYPTHTIKHNLVFTPRFKIKEGSAEKNVPVIDDKLKRKKMVGSNVFRAHAKKIIYPTLMENFKRKGKVNAVSMSILSEKKIQKVTDRDCAASDGPVVKVVKDVQKTSTPLQYFLDKKKEAKPAKPSDAIEENFQSLIRSHPTIDKASGEVKMKLKKRFIQLLLKSSPDNNSNSRVRKTGADEAKQEEVDISAQNVEKKLGDNLENQQDNEMQNVETVNEDIAKDTEQIMSHPLPASSQKMRNDNYMVRYPKRVWLDTSNSFDISKICIKESSTKTGTEFYPEAAGTEEPKLKYAHLEKEEEKFPSFVSPPSLQQKIDGAVKQIKQSTIESDSTEVKPEKIKKDCQDLQATRNVSRMKGAQEPKIENDKIHKIPPNERDRVEDTLISEDSAETLSKKKKALKLRQIMEKAIFKNDEANDISSVKILKSGNEKFLARLNKIKDEDDGMNEMSQLEDPAVPSSEEHIKKPTATRLAQIMKKQFDKDEAANVPNKRRCALEQEIMNNKRILFNLKKQREAMRMGIKLRPKPIPEASSEVGALNMAAHRAGLLHNTQKMTAVSKRMEREDTDQSEETSNISSKMASLGPNSQFDRSALNSCLSKKALGDENVKRTENNKPYLNWEGKEKKVVHPPPLLNTTFKESRAVEEVMNVLKQKDTEDIKMHLKEASDVQTESHPTNKTILSDAIFYKAGLKNIEPNQASKLELEIPAQDVNENEQDKKSISTSLQEAANETIHRNNEEAINSVNNDDLGNKPVLTDLSHDTEQPEDQNIPLEASGKVENRAEENTEDQIITARKNDDVLNDRGKVNILQVAHPITEQTSTRKNPSNRLKKVKKIVEEVESKDRFLDDIKETEKLNEVARKAEEKAIRKKLKRDDRKLYEEMVQRQQSLSSLKSNNFIPRLDKVVDVIKEKVEIGEKVKEKIEKMSSKNATTKKSIRAVECDSQSVESLSLKKKKTPGKKEKKTAIKKEPPKKSKPPLLLLKPSESLRKIELQEHKTNTKGDQKRREDLGDFGDAKEYTKDPNKLPEQKLISTDGQPVKIHKESEKTSEKLSQEEKNLEETKKSNIKMQIAKNNEQVNKDQRGDAVDSDSPKVGILSKCSTDNKSPKLDAELEDTTPRPETTVKDKIESFSNNLDNEKCIIAEEVKQVQNLKQAIETVQSLNVDLSSTHGIVGDDVFRDCNAVKNFKSEILNKFFDQKLLPGSSQQVYFPKPSLIVGNNTEIPDEAPGDKVMLANQDNRQAIKHENDVSNVTLPDGNNQGDQKVPVTHYSPRQTEAKHLVANLMEKASELQFDLSQQALVDVEKIDDMIEKIKDLEEMLLLQREAKISETHLENKARLPPIPKSPPEQDKKNIRKDKPRGPRDMVLPPKVRGSNSPLPDNVPSSQIEEERAEPAKKANDLGKELLTDKFFSRRGVFDETPSVADEIISKVILSPNSSGKNRNETADLEKAISDFIRQEKLDEVVDKRDPVKTENTKDVTREKTIREDANKDENNFNVSKVVMDVFKLKNEAGQKYVSKENLTVEQGVSASSRKQTPIRNTSQKSVGKKELLPGQPKRNSSGGLTKEISALSDNKPKIQPTMTGRKNVTFNKKLVWTPISKSLTQTTFDQEANRRNVRKIQSVGREVGRKTTESPLKTRNNIQKMLPPRPGSCPPATGQLQKLRKLGETGKFVGDKTGVRAASCPPNSFSVGNIKAAPSRHVSCPPAATQRQKLSKIEENNLFVDDKIGARASSCPPKSIKLGSQEPKTNDSEILQSVPQQVTSLLSTKAPTTTTTNTSSTSVVKPVSPKGCNIIVRTVSSKQIRCHPSAERLKKGINGEKSANLAHEKIDSTSLPFVYPPKSSKVGLQEPKLKYFNWPSQSVSQQTVRTSSVSIDFRQKLKEHKIKYSSWSSQALPTKMTSFPTAPADVNSVNELAHAEAENSGPLVTRASSQKDATKTSSLSVPVKRIGFDSPSKPAGDGGNKRKKTAISSFSQQEMCLSDKNLQQNKPVGVLHVILPKPQQRSASVSLEAEQKALDKPKVTGFSSESYLYGTHSKTFGGLNVDYDGGKKNIARAGISTSPPFKKSENMHLDTQLKDSGKKNITTPKKDDKDKKAIFRIQYDGEVFIIKKADETFGETKKIEAKQPDIMEENNTMDKIKKEKEARSPIEGVKKCDETITKKENEEKPFAKIEQVLVKPSDKEKDGLKNSQSKMESNETKNIYRKNQSETILKTRQEIEDIANQLLNKSKGRSKSSGDSRKVTSQKGRSQIENDNTTKKVYEKSIFKQTSCDAEAPIKKCSNLNTLDLKKVEREVMEKSVHFVTGNKKTPKVFKKETEKDEPTRVKIEIAKVDVNVYIDKNSKLAASNIVKKNFSEEINIDSANSNKKLEENVNKPQDEAKTAFNKTKKNEDTSLGVEPTKLFNISIKKSKGNVLVSDNGNTKIPVKKYDQVKSNVEAPKSCPYLSNVKKEPSYKKDHKENERTVGFFESQPKRNDVTYKSKASEEFKMYKKENENLPQQNSSVKVNKVDKVYSNKHAGFVLDTKNKHENINHQTESGLGMDQTKTSENVLLNVKKDMLKRRKFAEVTKVDNIYLRKKSTDHVTDATNKDTHLSVSNVLGPNYLDKPLETKNPNLKKIELSPDMGLEDFIKVGNIYIKKSLIKEVKEKKKLTQQGSKNDMHLLKTVEDDVEMKSNEAKDVLPQVQDGVPNDNSNIGSMYTLNTVDKFSKVQGNPDQEQTATKSRKKTPVVDNTSNGINPETIALKMISRANDVRKSTKKALRYKCEEENAGFQLEKVFGDKQNLYKSVKSKTKIKSLAGSKTAQENEKFRDEKLDFQLKTKTSYEKQANRTYTDYKKDASKPRKPMIMVKCKISPPKTESYEKTDAVSLETTNNKCPKEMALDTEDVKIQNRGIESFFKPRSAPEPPMNTEKSSAIYKVNSSKSTTTKIEENKVLLEDKADLKKDKLTKSTAPTAEEKTNLEKKSVIIKTKNMSQSSVKIKDEAISDTNIFKDKKNSIASNLKDINEALKRIIISKIEEITDPKNNVKSDEYKEQNAVNRKNDVLDEPKGREELSKLKISKSVPENGRKVKDVVKTEATDSNKTSDNLIRAKAVEKNIKNAAGNLVRCGIMEEKCLGTQKKVGDQKKSIMKKERELGIKEDIKRDRSSKIMSQPNNSKNARPVKPDSELGATKSRSTGSMSYLGKLEIADQKKRREPIVEKMRRSKVEEYEKKGKKRGKKDVIQELNTTAKDMLRQKKQQEFDGPRKGSKRQKLYEKDTKVSQPSGGPAQFSLKTETENSSKKVNSKNVTKASTTSSKDSSVKLMSKAEFLKLKELEIINKEDTKEKSNVNDIKVNKDQLTLSKTDLGITKKTNLNDEIITYKIKKMAQLVVDHMVHNKSNQKLLEYNLDEEINVGNITFIKPRNELNNSFITKKKEVDNLPSSKSKVNMEAVKDVGKTIETIKAPVKIKKVESASLPEENQLTLVKPELRSVKVNDSLKERNIKPSLQGVDTIDDRCGFFVKCTKLQDYNLTQESPSKNVDDMTSLKDNADKTLLTSEGKSRTIPVTDNAHIKYELVKLEIDKQIEEKNRNKRNRRLKIQSLRSMSHREIDKKETAMENVKSEILLEQKVIKTNTLNLEDTAPKRRSTKVVKSQQRMNKTTYKIKKPYQKRNFTYKPKKSFCKRYILPLKDPSNVVIEPMGYYPSTLHKPVGDEVKVVPKEILAIEENAKKNRFSKGGRKFDPLTKYAHLKITYMEVKRPAQSEESFLPVVKGEGKKSTEQENKAIINYRYEILRRLNKDFQQIQSHPTIPKPPETSSVDTVPHSFDAPPAQSDKPVAKIIGPVEKDSEITIKEKSSIKKDGMNSAKVVLQIKSRAKGDLNKVTKSLGNMMVKDKKEESEGKIGNEGKHEVKRNDGGPKIGDGKNGVGGSRKYSTASDK